MKKKGTTALLALMFGLFGVHRFYLGQRLKGFLQVILFMITMIITIEEDAPVIFIPAIIGFIDAVLFYVMPEEEFDEKYNQRYLRADEERHPSRFFEKRGGRNDRQRQRRSVAVEPVSPFKQSGMRKYDDFDIQGAIVDFRKALNVDFKDAQVHFLLACSYSINEEPEKALFHLDKAVDFGFVDFDKIHEANALAHLRTHDRFEEFVKNSYQIPRYLPAEEETQLNQMEDEKANDLLDQIAALGTLYEKGVLTPDEFHKQKQKLFGK